MFFCVVLEVEQFALDCALSHAAHGFGPTLALLLPAASLLARPGQREIFLEEGNGGGALRVFDFAFPPIDV